MGLIKLENLSLIYPEIFLSIVAMILLMFGVFNQKTQTTNLLLGSSAFAILVSIYILFYLGFRNMNSEAYIFSGAFEFSNFTMFMKLLAGISAFAVCLISINEKTLVGDGKNYFEYPVLVLLSLVGANILISANDLISVYLGLELLSLSSYVLCAINRDDNLSSEAAVKYFILGALASGLILFGSSLVYGFAGDTNITMIFNYISRHAEISQITGLVLGLSLIFSGFIFKISAAPMHMWAPDVYEGVSKPVLAFLATLPKVAAIAFVIRMLSSQPEFLQSSFAQILAVVSILSMVIGSFAGLRQSNIKRLLAYSSIANIGYMLIAILVVSLSSISSAVFYLTIYIITLVGIFAIISSINSEDKKQDRISSLAGLSRTHPVTAISLSIMMFSIAGIPPMAGFMGKFFVFVEAINAGNYAIAVIGVLTSVVACYYYLRIIKTMYFDEASEIKLIIKYSNSCKFLIAVSVIFSLTLVFYVDWLIKTVSNCVSSIF